MSCRDTKGWQALAFFVYEMGPIQQRVGGKLSIHEYAHKGACRGRAFSKEAFLKYFFWPKSKRGTSAMHPKPAVQMLGFEVL